MLVVTLWEGDHGGMSIDRGTHLESLTAAGERIVLVALGPARKGRDIPVVPVCTVEEYDEAQAVGNEPEGFLWPLNAVQVLQA